MSFEPQWDAIVVGGGITGLAALHRLTQAGVGRSLLLEGTGRVGGVIVTERVGDYLVEGGPDSFLASKPEGLGLCRELGLEPDLRPTQSAARMAYVKRAGRLHRIPPGLSGMVPARWLPLLQSSLLSLGGRIRALGEPVMPRGRPGDESVASFVRRRFGWEMAEWMVEPLLAGIYAGDPERLSRDAVAPALAECERRHGRLLGKLRPPHSGDHPRGFVTLAGGMVQLVEGLSKEVPAGAIRTGTPVVAVESAAEGWRVRLAQGEPLVARSVILATPAWATARLLDRSAPSIATELSQIEYAATAIISLGFGNDVLALPQGSGYLIPRLEGGMVTACSWSSNKFPDRAPPRGAMVRVFVGRAGADLPSDDERLVELAREEVARTLGGRGAVPEVVRVYRWPRAMPQYTLGHLDRLRRIGALLSAYPGLRLAGASYRGVGIPDCIRQGREAAEAALDRRVVEVT